MLIDRLRNIATQGISADTETYLIVPGNLVPPLVLGSIAWVDENAQVKGALLTKDQSCELIATLAEDLDKILVGMNIAFDLAVWIKEFAKRGIDLIPYIATMLQGPYHGMPEDYVHDPESTEVFKYPDGSWPGIHNGRVFDIQHSMMLDAIANGVLGKNPKDHSPLRGRYSQDTIIQLLFERDDAKKNDAFRLRYGEFDGMPLDQLPLEAQQYPVDDTVNAMQAALAECGLIPRVAPSHDFDKEGRCTRCGATSMSQSCWVTRMNYNMTDLAAQTSSAFWTHMAAAGGFRIDQSYVDKIEKHATEAYAENIKPFIEAGLVRADGSEDRSQLKRRVAVAYGAKGTCTTCNGTGKVPSPANPKSKIICFKMSDDGVTKVKTCDGTGMVLNANVPTSEKGGISYGRSHLIESGDEFLMEYASVLEDAKIRNVYCPGLRTARTCISCGHHGIEDDPHEDGCAMAGWKDIPLTLRINPILDTKRISIDGFVMLLPRKAGYLDAKTQEYIPSLRECFVPPPPKYEEVEVPDDYVLQPDEKWV